MDLEFGLLLIISSKFTCKRKKNIKTFFNDFFFHRYYLQFSFFIYQFSYFQYIQELWIYYSSFFSIIEAQYIKFFLRIFDSNNRQNCGWNRNFEQLFQSSKLWRVSKSCQNCNVQAQYRQISSKRTYGKLLAQSIITASEQTIFSFESTFFLWFCEYFR